VPDRIANVFVLVEDAMQQNFVKRFLQQRWGQQYAERRLRWAPLAPGRGAAEQRVRREYPGQVKACRSTIGRRVSCLLIVVLDADQETVGTRRRRLDAELQRAGQPPRGKSEPIVLLIPKRHVETWIRALVGNPVDEAIDYTRPAPTPQEVKRAAAGLCNALDAADPPPHWPPSLVASVPEWRKIPG